MKKNELLQLCGNIQQVAGVESVEYSDICPGGLKAALVHNGLLEYALMLDKCLDPAWLKYKGMNISFLTKPGLQGKTAYDTGDEAARSIMCGAMMTCGFENIHGCCQIDGVSYPTHGRMRSTHAEHVGMDACFKQEDYVISVTGQMREASIFGENLVLRRSVTTRYGSSSIQFVDEIENQAFREEPFCFLYHCNMGYPFLTKDCKIFLPSLQCIPRDEASKSGISKHLQMEAPVDNAPEQVYLHILAGDSGQNTVAAVVNEQLKIAYCLRFSLKEMPYLTEWKSIASGDYALALEPCNAGFDGRRGAVERLQPGEKRKHVFSIEILEGDALIASLKKEIEILINQEGIVRDDICLKL